MTSMMCVGDEQYTTFVGKPEGDRQHGKPKRRRRKILKCILKIHAVTNQRWAYANTVMNLRLPQQARSFLTSSVIVITRETLLSRFKYLDSFPCPVCSQKDYQSLIPNVSKNKVERSQWLAVNSWIYDKWGLHNLWQTGSIRLARVFFHSTKCVNTSVHFRTSRRIPQKGLYRSPY